MSIRIKAKIISVEVQVPSLIIVPPTDDLLDFKDATKWGCLADELDTAIADPTILLDHYHLSIDICLVLVDIITQRTTSIVRDSSFSPDSLVGLAGYYDVVLAPSVDCDTTLYTKGANQ